MISLRIENLLLNNANDDNKEYIFKEGSVLKGQILDVLEEFILIDIKGHGVLKVTLEGELKALKGDEVSFLVKSHINNEIQIKQLMNEEPLKNHLTTDIYKDNSISKLLKNFNIKESKISIALMENLMKYNAPINEQNLTDGIKSLEKLIQLLNLSEDDKVVLISGSITEKEFTKENRLEISNPKGQETIIKESRTKELILPDKINIKNLLITNADHYPEKEDLSTLVKEFLGTGINIENEDEFIKMLSFFIKNDIKPSLNNIKNLKELNQDPIEFSKDFEKIDVFLSKLKNNDNIEKLKDFDFNIDFTKKNILKNSVQVEELKKVLEESGNKINLKEDIKNLENKIDFLKEMNKDLSFLFLPMNFGKKELNGVLTLLKENKKKRSGNNKTNVLINLSTSNLGNIRISCQAISTSLSVKINIKKEDIELFKSMEEQLIRKVSLIGYSINKIEFIIDEDIQIMDAIASNPNPTYFLDIKV